MKFRDFFLFTETALLVPLLTLPWLLRKGKFMAFDRRRGILLRRHGTGHLAGATLCAGCGLNFTYDRIALVVAG